MGGHFNPFTTYIKTVGGRYTRCTIKPTNRHTHKAQANAISHADLMMEKYEAFKATVGPLDAVN